MDLGTRLELGQVVPQIGDALILAAFVLLLTLLALPLSRARAEDGASDGPPPADLTTLTIEQLMANLDVIEAYRVGEPVPQF